jgi:hypothetical protein
MLTYPLPPFAKKRSFSPASNVAPLALRPCVCLITLNQISNLPHFKNKLQRNRGSGKLPYFVAIGKSISNVFAPYARVEITSRVDRKKRV